MGLKAQMEKGREEARAQMDALNKQQEALEQLKSPEDIMKFMSEGGMSMEDMQRMFSGDQAFMEEKMKAMIERQSGPGSKKLEETVKEADKAVKAADVLHSSLMGSTDIETAEAKLRDIAAGKGVDGGYPQEKKEEKKKKPAEPP